MTGLWCQKKTVTGPKPFIYLSSFYFPPAAEDLGSLHVLHQLFCQPSGLCFYGQQLQKGLQARLPCHVSVAHEAESQGGKHGCTGRGRAGSPGSQRRSRVALSFIWILKATPCIRTLYVHCLFIVCAGDESSLPTLACVCMDQHTRRHRSDTGLSLCAKLVLAKITTRAHTHTHTEEQFLPCDLLKRTNQSGASLVTFTSF